MKKRIFLSVAVMLCAYQAIASEVMCLKTNTGQFIEVVRVSMMVIPDGGSTFDILVKDGEGAANVQSVSFEKHESDIDLSKYSGSSSGYGEAPDYSKPFFLMTNTGKFFYMKDKPELIAKEGSNNFDVKVGSTTESNVGKIYFFRGTEEEAGQAAGIETPKTVAEENLVLTSPISSQMTISGCGAAVEAVLYAADGRMVGKAAVSNGVSTVQVGHLTRGVYFVKVGKKSLKFMKK
jgi:hypothetical protein